MIAEAGVTKPGVILKDEATLSITHLPPRANAIPLHGVCRVSTGRCKTDLPRHICTGIGALPRHICAGIEAQPHHICAGICAIALQFRAVVKALAMEEKRKSSVCVLL